MSQLLIFLYLQFMVLSPSQDAGLSGTYAYKSKVKNGPTGRLLVYEQPGLTFDFFLEINRGAPSYNMGEVYGKAYLQSHKGIWQYQLQDSANGINCTLTFSFENYKATIKTISNKGECGFGYAVVADGIYKEIDTATPAFFITAAEDTFYFNKTTPESFYKR